MLAAWVGVMVITAIGLYEAEKGVNPAIQSLTDAVWWGIATMTTVGYGDVVPLTPEGRLFAAALMILGIGLFAAVTATMTSFFLADDANGDVPSQIERLAGLHAAGALTEDEFSTAKARLLARL
jgi:voltage-gated potassium channel